MPRLITVLAASCAALSLIPLASAQQAPPPAQAPVSAPAAAPATPTAAPQLPPAKPYVPTVTRAQPNLPRTSFGQPSLEGVWTSNFIMPLESSPQAPMLVLPEGPAKAMADTIANIIAAQLDRQLDPEVPALIKTTDGLGIVLGERRTRMIVEPADGKIPYTPAGKTEAARGQGMGAFDNPEDRPNWERCVASMGRAPVGGVGETNPRMIIQTPTQVVIFTEYGSEARIIPFTDKHKPKMFWGLLGDSIAHWEGNTLVIETVGLPEKDRVRLFPSYVVSGEATVIEKYTRLTPNELLYQFTVIDPKVYAQAWLGEFSIYKSDGRLYEHACHEGNYSVPNILRAARVAEERAELKKVAAKPSATPKPQ